MRRVMLEGRAEWGYFHVYVVAVLGTIPKAVDVTPGAPVAQLDRAADF